REAGAVDRLVDVARALGEELRQARRGEKRPSFCEAHLRDHLARRRRHRESRREEFGELRARAEVLAERDDRRLALAARWVGCLDAEPDREILGCRDEDALKG